MGTILSTICSAISSSLVKILLSGLNCAKEIFSYLNNCRKDKIEQQKKNEDKEFGEKVDNVVDNGDINDLLSLKR